MARIEAINEFREKCKEVAADRELGNKEIAKIKAVTAAAELVLQLDMPIEMSFAFWDIRNELLSHGTYKGNSATYAEARLYGGLSGLCDALRKKTSITLKEATETISQAAKRPTITSNKIKNYRLEIIKGRKPQTAERAYADMCSAFDSHPSSDNEEIRADICQMAELLSNQSDG